MCVFFLPLPVAGHRKRGRLHGSWHVWQGRGQARWPNPGIHHAVDAEPRKDQQDGAGRASTRNICSTAATSRVRGRAPHTSWHTNDSTNFSKLDVRLVESSAGAGCDSNYEIPFESATPRKRPLSREGIRPCNDGGRSTKLFRGGARTRNARSWRSGSRGGRGTTGAK